MILLVAAGADDEDLEAFTESYSPGILGEVVDPLEADCTSDSDLVGVQNKIRSV